MLPSFLRFRRAPKTAPAGPTPAILPGYEKDRDNPRSRKLRRIRYVGVTFGAFIYAFLYVLLPPAFLSILLLPLAILTLFVIWALPVSNFAPPKALTVCFWLFFTTMYLWPNYLALALPGLPWITVARLFGGPMLAILLICASASKPFRERMAELLNAEPWIWKFVAAFAVVQLVSIFFSGNPYQTVNRVISQQIIWTGVFFASVWVFQKPEKIVLWGRLLIAIAVFVSIIGEIEAQYQMVLWANSIPSFLQIEDPAVQRVLAGTSRNGIYRIVSTSMNPLNLAEFLALTTPFILHELRTAKTALMRFALVAIDVLVIHAIILTDSRLGLVGALATHAVYGLIWMGQKWRSERGTLIGPAVTIAYPALLAALAVVVLAVPRLRVSILGGGRQQSSNDAREAQFDMMPDVFIQRPIFGYGSGEGGARLGYVNAGGQGTIDSYLLSIILDYGMVGFICFYGLIIGGIAAAVKLALSRDDRYSSLGIPIALFMLALLLIRFVLSNEFNLPLMFMMLGAIVGLKAYNRTVSDTFARAPSEPKMRGSGTGLRPSYAGRL